MEQYNVICTAIFNREITVRAESKEEAMDKASDVISAEFDECGADSIRKNWEFGEATADSAEPSEKWDDFDDHSKD